VLDFLVNASLAIGAAFVLVAAIGIIRLPDLLTRMHAATKAGTLGAGLLYVAVALAVPGDGVAVKSGAIIAFLLLTAPIASHVIARAAYHRGEVDLWDRTRFDELHEALSRRSAHPPRPADAPPDPKSSIDPENRRSDSQHENIQQRARL